MRQLRGLEAVERALDAGQEVTLVLLPQRGASRRAEALARRARSAGIEVRRIGPPALARYAQDAEGVELLALQGRRPEPTVEAILGAGGAAWLLAGIRYPGNAGFAIRAAEVSGSTGVILDAAFDHVGRREATRASMRADWFMPVCWAPALPTVEAARASGHRIIAIEDAGRESPWEVDLRGSLLLVVGGEREGTPAALLERAHHVVRIPMAGFIPSYNLQAAVAVLAAERLRQLGVR
ncbi:MAG: TrmH family RNA methyltransferase [Myxococcota bacterium]